MCDKCKDLENALERQMKITTSLHREVEQLKRRKEYFMNIKTRHDVNTWTQKLKFEIEDMLDDWAEFFELDDAIRKYLGIQYEKYGAMNLLNRTKSKKTKELCQHLVDMYARLGYDDE